MSLSRNPIKRLLSRLEVYNHNSTVLPGAWEKSRRVRIFPCLPGPGQEGEAANLGTWALWPPCRYTGQRVWKPPPGFSMVLIKSLLFRFSWF